jgi:hypothetical protein
VVNKPNSQSKAPFIVTHTHDKQCQNFWQRWTLQYQLKRIFQCCLLLLPPAPIHNYLVTYLTAQQQAFAFYMYIRLCNTIRVTYVGVLISLWFSKRIVSSRQCYSSKGGHYTPKTGRSSLWSSETPGLLACLAPSDYYLFANLFIKPKTYQPPPHIQCRVQNKI